MHATHFGQAPLKMHTAHAFASQTPPPDTGTLQMAWKKLKSRFDSKEVGFYWAPFQNEISQAQEAKSLAEQVLKNSKIQHCLFLGIGGSSLGPKSLLESLKEKTTSPIQFHFLENPDPLEWASVTQSLQPDSTLVCIVTKSGTTFETLTQALLALEWIGSIRWKTHVVAITDPEKGDLRRFATASHIPTLSIAPSVGGRFSLFTPVGLFPAALAGLSISDFLQGAQEIHEWIEQTPVEKNPLFRLAHEWIQGFPKRSVHVCMPYSTRLQMLSQWFVQLWGESLGKDGKGFTPLAALGPSDQHSILQLLRDGPADKMLFFMTLNQTSQDFSTPETFDHPPAQTPCNPYAFSAFQILKGQSLHQLMRTEYEATSRVLSQQNRPHLTFELEALHERTLGALYYTLCVAVAYTGTLWGVDPFDQPGVEEGKIYIRESLQNQREIAIKR